MATSYIDYTGDGANNKTFSFPSFQSSDVKVEVENVIKTATTHYNITNYTTSGGGTVVFTSGNIPTSGQSIRVYRDTDITTGSGEYEPKATFTAGSSVKATDLNNNQKQALYAIWEEKEQTVITTDIKDGSITTAKIAADAIDGTKLADNAVNSEHYTDGSIDTAHYAAGSVNTTALGADAVDATKLADNAVGAEHIQANAVGASELADNAVDTAAIADNAVNSDKIVAGAIVNADINASAAIAGSKIAAATTSAAGAMSAADKTKLDGIETSATADQTNAEIRAAVEAASDSNVFTDADHTKLNGIAASANNYSISADLLDEDNFSSDSATKPPSQQSTKAYITATSQPLDSDLTTLASMQAGTASILAGGTALTSTLTELNLLDGKSIVTTVSGSSTDVQLPTAKAVNDQIINTLSDVGGFVPIADELKFPNTNPDPNDDAGTIVSIADAGGIVVNGSGVSTTGRTLGGSTVTINGIDSSLNSTTIAAGKGMLVQTTSTLNTYTYHRLIVDEAGVASAQTLVNNFNDRYQVAASAPSAHPDGSALQDGDLWFDTTANEMKVYDLGNTTYSVVSSVGNFYISTLSSYSGTGGNSASFNGSAYRFVLSNIPSNAQQLIVSINGVIQKPNSGTSQPSEGFAVDGSSILFSSAPATGSDYFIIHIGASVNIGTPSNNTVTTAILQNASVATAKIADDAVTADKLANSINTEIAANTAKVTNATHTGEVTGATALTITDDVVDEANLKISNAGSNGQFLSKQSGDTGGLTWATVDTSIADDSIAEVKLDISNTASDGQYLQYKDSTDKLTWATPAQYTTPLTTRGDILYRGASADARLAKGTAGQYLKIGANDPEWADVVGAVADGCIFENDQTISNNHTIASGKGAHSVGPITVNATVTVNGNWVVS